MNAKEQYELNLQDLMGSVPTSAVAKQLDVIIDEDNDKIIDRQIRWVISDHVVYSGLRTVYSIEAEDLEVFKFILKRADYKKFVSACKARRKELYGTRRIKKALEIDTGWIFNIKKVRRIMKKYNLKVRYFNVYNKKKIEENVKPNLLRRNFYAEVPNQKWSTDITYLIHKGKNNSHESQRITRR